MHGMHDGALAGIDLNLLVVLRALLSERHVTRAAARVGLSQSATSHALSRLRELYQDPLLVRSGRSLVLTPRAQRLLPALERGLSDLKAAVQPEPAFEPATARRSFSLGMADYGQAFLLGALLRAIEHEAPGIQLTVLNFPRLEELTVAGSIDLALHLSDMVQPPLKSEQLFDDDFVCLVRRDHPQVRKQLRLERYVQLQHVVVAPSGAAGSLVDDELAKRGLTRNVALCVSNFLIAPIVVSETDFINTMPRRLAQQLVKRYPLRVLPTPLPLPKFGLSSMWHPRLDRDPAHVWLRDLVKRVAHEV
jgi:DNA-binding transcriptional LysR family regulator